MEKSSLIVRKRERTGKIGVAKVRKDKMIPGVIYGKGIDSLSIEVAPEDLKKALATESYRNTLLEINIENSDTSPALSILKDVQKDPVSGKTKHLDFQSIDPNSALKVDVPIEFVGTSRGIKEGGILEATERNFKIKCLPENIPGRIEVDITELGVGDSLHVRDITPAENIQILNNPKDTVVMVIAPRAAISEAAQQTAETKEDAETEESSGETQETTEESSGN